MASIAAPISSTLLNAKRPSPLGSTVPNPSLVPEAFMDTPVINGTAYPSVTLPQGVYRFRILNAANDRMFNLSLFYAADKDGHVPARSNARAARLVLPKALGDNASTFDTDSGHV